MNFTTAIFFVFLYYVKKLSYAEPTVVIEKSPDDDEFLVPVLKSASLERNKKCIGEGQFYCPASEQCVPQIWLCDGNDDCKEAEDEDNCSAYEDKQPSCKSDEFMCTDKTCVRVKQVCDGANDCADHSDETHPSCADKKQKDDDDNDDDNDDDERQGQDENEDENENEACFGDECAKFFCDANTSIDARKKCDGRRDCDNGADELPSSCPPLNCLPDEFTCPHKCIDEAMRCDGVDDCGDNSDENATLCDSLKSLPCAKGLHFKCKNNDICIHSDWLCDGIEDCDDGSDESNDVCDKSRATCDDLRLDSCEKSQIRCNAFDMDYFPTIRKCDGVLGCTDGQDEKGCPPCNSTEFLYQDDCLNFLPSPLDVGPAYSFDNENA